MNEVDFVAKYGPTGILALMLIGAGKVALQVIGRWFTLCDKIEATLDDYRAMVRAAEVTAEKRHSETRGHITAESDLTRRDTRQAVADLKDDLVQLFRDAETE